MPDARPIPDFPDYTIERDGTVRRHKSGRLCRPSRTKRGAVKVTLYREGIAYTKSLALLVAKAWLYNDHDPEIFDTPIHLDNDPLNNHVDNLAWRPRWFAVKYHQQYWNLEFRTSTVQVQDLTTGEIYKTLLDVCQTHGFLYVDVLNSCNRGDRVFPKWKIFRFV